MAEVDGLTTVIFTDEEMPAASRTQLVFEGALLAPNLELSICSVDKKNLLTIATSSATANVKIYANDANEPSDIVVLAQ